ncbi:MAG: 4-hydroxythreonine-4-phosphate dehydrogenase PdxA, partial [Phycisphaerae bacterium]|nr:4-hydroxythreonine-4-phosphate dehydrogenase PdxA [Phycisphaerae bacterium]
MAENNHKNSDEPLVIGITMGEPLGIGPEIIVKALYDPFVRRGVKFIIFGMDEFLEYAADFTEIEPYWGRCQHEKISRDLPRNIIVADYDDYSMPVWGKGPSKAGGEASLRFFEDAIEAAKAGIIDAIVTAPISKTSWKMAEAEWPGHTEMLAAMCKSPRKAMMFAAGPLKIALATIHESLFELRNKFT